MCQVRNNKSTVFKKVIHFLRLAGRSMFDLSEMNYMIWSCWQFLKTRPRALSQSGIVSYLDKWTALSLEQLHCPTTCLITHPVETERHLHSLGGMLMCSPSFKLQFLVCIVSWGKKSGLSDVKILLYLAALFATAAANKTQVGWSFSLFHHYKHYKHYKQPLSLYSYFSVLI